MRITPIRIEDGKRAKYRDQKAKRFAEHLENILQPHEDQEVENIWKKRD